MKPEYLMLAHSFKPGKNNVGGWYASEKLDGTRAFWDGGVSRGMAAADVPYANTVKDHRLVELPVATGLWSRSGKVIYAPNDWLDQLPQCPLDGELFLGRGEFQALRKVVAEHKGGKGWNDVKFMAFDSPRVSQFGCEREIKIRSQYSFWVKQCQAFFHGIETVQESWTYEHVIKFIENRAHGPVHQVSQQRLPLNHLLAIERLVEILDNLVACGAEGVMLRNPASRWECRRSHNLLKYKPWNDAEGRLSGFTSGRITERGSRLRGKIGALILDFNGKRLELSGLTDAEREFRNAADQIWAWQHPGEDMPSSFKSNHFKMGDEITFKYRELSDDGIPKEARYWRKR